MTEVFYYQQIWVHKCDVCNKTEKSFHINSILEVSAAIDQQLNESAHSASPGKQKKSKDPPTGNSIFELMQKRMSKLFRFYAEIPST